MARQETVKRMYSGRVELSSDSDRSNRVMNCIDTTMEIYRRGTIAALDFLLAVSASVRPLNNFPIVEETIEKPKKKKDQEQPSKVLTWTPALACFTNWFVLERDTTAKEFIVDDESVVKLFYHYWVANGGDPSDFIDPLLQTHLDCVTKGCRRDESVWIDRYHYSVHYCQRFGIPQEYLNQIALNFGWPFVLSNSTANDASKTARELCSLLCGSGVKTDWNTMKSFCDNAKSILDSRNWEGATKKELHQTFKSKQITRVPRGGRLDSLETIVMGQFNSSIQENSTLEKKDIKSYYDSIAKKLKKSDSRNDFPTDFDWKNVFDTFTVFDYRGENDRIAEFSQMFMIAMSAYGSWKSNSKNQCFERQLAFDDYVKAKEKINSVPETLHKEVEVYKDDHEQLYLNFWQFKKLPAVMKISEKQGLSLENSVKELQGYDSDIGDCNFLLHIAKTVPKEEISLHSLKILSNIDEAKEKVDHMLFPSLLHFESRSCYPHFGGMNPYGVLTHQTGSKSFFIQFNVINNHGKFFPIKLKVRSKRLYNEIFANKSNEGSPRNTRLFRIKNDAENGVHTFLPEGKSFSFQLFKRNIPGSEELTYYCRIFVDLLPDETPKIDVLQKKEDLRILAVDRGWRNAGAWSLLERSEKGILLKNLNKKTKGIKSCEKFSIKACGFLTDVQKFQMIDDTERLSSGGRPPTKEELTFLRHAGDQVGRKWNYQEPKDYASFLNELAKICRSAVKSKKTLAEDLVHSIKIFTTGRKRGLNDKGGLSFARIDGLDGFLSAYFSLIRYFQNEEKPVPDWLIDARDHLLKKRVSRRMERAKVTASRIMEVAVRNRADIVMLESLSLQTSRGSQRGMNRKISQWLHPRILEFIKNECKLHGIFFREVFAAGTSVLDSSDFDHEITGTRFTSEKNEGIIKKTVHSVLNDDEPKVSEFSGRHKHWKWYKDFIESRCRNMTNVDEIATRVAQLNTYISGLGGELFRLKNPEVYPVKYRVDYKYVDSDINAATNIAVRGLRYFYQFADQKKKSEQ